VDVADAVSLSVLDKLQTPGYCVPKETPKVTVKIDSSSAEPASFEKLSMKPIKRIVDPQLIDYLATNFPQNNEYSGKV